MAPMPLNLDSLQLLQLGPTIGEMNSAEGDVSTVSVAFNSPI